MMPVHFYTSSSNLRQVLSVLFVIVVLYGSINHVTYLLSSPESYTFRPGFYDAENVEVLFAGTSHMYDAVYPMELYRDYGISSYNIANSGERIAMSYYSIEDAIMAHKEIKLVVIDMHGLNYGNYKNDPEVPKRCHYTFDAMKWGKVKLNGIIDCVDRDLWPEFFFPLYIYHDRWINLKEADFAKAGSKREIARGGNYEMGVSDVAAPKVIPYNEYDHNSDYSTEYLEKIVNMCKDRDIQVLMVCIPFPASLEAQRQVNRAYEIAKKHSNAKYVNYLLEVDDIGLDYHTDMADKNSHLNPLGARKFTSYIGGFINNNYDLTDYSDDVSWENMYNYYLNGVKDTYFSGTLNLYQYLMLCADCDYYCEICMDNEYQNHNSDVLMKKLISEIEQQGNLSCDELLQDNNSYRTVEEWEDSKPVLKVGVYRTCDGESVDVSIWDGSGQRLEKYD